MFAERISRRVAVADAAIRAVDLGAAQFLVLSVLGLDAEPVLALVALVPLNVLALVVIVGAVKGVEDFQARRTLESACADGTRSHRVHARTIISLHLKKYKSVMNQERF